MWILFFMGIGVLVMAVLGVSVLLVLRDSDEETVETKDAKPGRAI